MTLAQRSTDYLNSISDPTIFGPGLWFSIHLKARYSISPIQMKEFIKYIEIISDNLKCEKCKVHMINYIDENPVENEWGNEYRLKNGTTCYGMFYWSWKFHNNVNKRIGKVVISLDDAYMLFDKTVTICTESCKNIGKDYTKEQMFKLYQDKKIGGINL